MFDEIWSLQDEAFDLMEEYDGMPHRYSNETMYQTEGRIIDLIAERPGITCTEIASVTKKTPSACSQMVKKLKERGYVRQERNERNNRIYNLCLTGKGEKMYEDRRTFNRNCQEIMKEKLFRFTDEELKHYVEVQKQINIAYQGDIDRSRKNLQLP